MSNIDDSPSNTDDAVPRRRRNKGGKRGGGGCQRGYKPGEVYLQPHSPAKKALDVLREETARVHHALTLAMWRDAFAVRHGPAPTDFATTVNGLRKRGFVRIAGGRIRALQYAPADSVVPPVVDPLVEAVVDAVRAACERTGFAVDMGAVASALDDAGVRLSSDELRNLLKALCTTPPTAVVAAHVPARLEMREGTGRYWGRGRWFWQPAGSSYPVPIERLDTRTAAIRAAVHKVTRALTRTCALSEMKAWAQAHADDPAAALLTGAGYETRFTLAVRGNVTLDTTRGLGVRDVSHPLATRGGLPLRLALDSATPAEVAAGRFTDTCAWLRPVEDLGSCERLREESVETRNLALGKFAEARVQQLACALVESLGSDIDVVELGRRTSRAERQLEAWHRSVTTARYPRPPRWLLDARQAAEAARRLPDLARVARPVERLLLAGAGGQRTAEEVLPWLEAVLRPEGRSCRDPQAHLSTVRRFPNPKFTRGPLYQETAESFSLLDVGDVVRVLSNLTTDGRLMVFLAGAVEMLGAVVRDPAPLLALLPLLPAANSYHRHGAVIALGALGVELAAEMAVTGPHDRAGFDAFAISVGMATTTPAGRAARLEAVRPLLAPAHHAWLDELCDRARAGDTVTLSM
jgi:hypothetical protein